MAIGDKALRTKLRTELIRFSQHVRPLPGINDPIALDVLIEQFVDSVHRVRYPSAIRRKAADKLARAANPLEIVFDPLQAAAHYVNNGDVEEATWLTFLFVHFGRNPKTKYQLARDIYGRLESGEPWTWRLVTSDKPQFIQWLEDNTEEFRRRGGRFGAHRRYESVTGLPKVFSSYMDCISRFGSHQEMFEKALHASGRVPTDAFDFLYNNVRIWRFGRLATFDYLSMIGKLRIAPILPGSAYISEGTGPLSGAKLLIYGDPDKSNKLDQLDNILIELNQYIGVGMQALEDALCNWQKHPRVYKYFQG